MPCNVLVRCILYIFLNIANDYFMLRCVHFTCVAHVIVVGRALVCGDATGIADSSRILTHFGFRHWCSVSAQISGFHGWRGLLKKDKGSILLKTKGKKSSFLSRDMAASVLCPVS